MRKFIFGIITLLAITTTSCTKTNEEKLKDAFREYAEKNLDDPSSLEILSIDSVDTISTRKCVDELLKDSAELSSMGKKELDDIQKMTKSIYMIPDHIRLNLYKDPTISNLYEELIASAELKAQKARMGLIYDYQGCLDRLKAYKDTCVCEIKFKIRMNKKVYDYVAYSDTTFTKFDFYLEENAVKDCELSKFMIDYLEFKAHELEEFKETVLRYKKITMVMKRIEEIAGMKVFEYK